MWNIKNVTIKEGRYEKLYLCLDIPTKCGDITYKTVNVKMDAEWTFKYGQRERIVKTYGCLELFASV